MAELSLDAVVVSKNPEWKTRTEQSTIKICSTILEAHEKVNNPHLDQKAKKAAVLKVANLTPELEWLVEFTKAESDTCLSSEDQKKKMTTIANNLNTHISKLTTNLQSAINSDSLDENKFNSIFPSLFKVLEEVTEFFKESHAAEIFRVIETNDDTSVQAKNLLNIDTPAMLVPQAKLLKLRAEEGKTNVTNLLFVQEADNKDLIGKFNLAQALLEETITPFIMASKEVLTDPENKEKKDLQKVQYDSTKSCLDEIKRILEQVKAKFLADWNAEKKAAKDPEWGKPDPARKLLKALGNSKFPNNPEKAQKALNMIPTHTKNLFNEINPPQEQKKAIVDAVKAARDGTIPEYFDAVQNLERLAKPQTLKIEMKSGDATNKMNTNRGDLLRAAKEMCMAMKDVNSLIHK